MLQQNLHRKVLGLRGISAGRTAGLQDCISYRNFEKIKLIIFNRSSTENVYLHIQFNYSSCCHPGNVDPAWNENRPNMVGQTELHDQEFHDLQSANLLDEPIKDKMNRKRDTYRDEKYRDTPLDDTSQNFPTHDFIIIQYQNFSK